MPWVIKGKNGGYMTRDGHSDASASNAWRFKSKADAERIANGMDVVSDTIRKGIDFPCAYFKGPAGDCNPWNCKCV